MTGAATTAVEAGGERASMAGLGTRPDAGAACAPGAAPEGADEEEEAAVALGFESFKALHSSMKRVMT